MNVLEEDNPLQLCQCNEVNCKKAHSTRMLRRRAEPSDWFCSDCKAMVPFGKPCRQAHQRPAAPLKTITSLAGTTTERIMQDADVQEMVQDLCRRVYDTHRQKSHPDQYDDTTPKPQWPTSSEKLHEAFNTAAHISRAHPFSYLCVFFLF